MQKTMHILKHRLRHNLINYKYIYKIPYKLYIQENKETVILKIIKILTKLLKDPLNVV